MAGWSSKNTSKKEEMSNPNNWRGIDLLDVIPKVISIVITNRLQFVLKKLEHLCSLAQHQKHVIQTI